MTLVHINTPRGWFYRTIRHCRVCKQRRRMILLAQPYYPFDLTCCTCGTRWSDGYRRKGSKRAARSAAATWPTAKPMKQMVADHKAYLEAT